MEFIKSHIWSHEKNEAHNDLQFRVVSLSNLMLIPFIMPEEYFGARCHAEIMHLFAIVQARYNNETTSISPIYRDVNTHQRT